MRKAFATLLVFMLVGLLIPNFAVRANYDTAYVSTPNEFVNALEDSYIKKILLENDITIDQRFQYIQIAGGKSIDGRDFSLQFDHSSIGIGYSLNLSNLKDSVFKVASAGQITVDHVENSEVSVFNFTNSFTVKNSSLHNSKLNSAEEIVIKNSILTDSPVKSTLYPLIISDSTLNNSPLSVNNYGNVFERITVTSDKSTPFAMSGGDAKVTDSTFITKEAAFNLSINRGTLTLEGQTSLQGATESAISVSSGLVYVKGNIHQDGNAFTIKSNRENIFTTQVHDLFGQLKKSQDSNLVSYYNTSDRNGVEPPLPDAEKYLPTELKDVTFLKQDYNEVTVVVDNPDLLLMVMDGNGKTYRTRPDRMGECSIILPNQPIGSTVYVYAFSPDGNQSKVQTFLIDQNATVPLYVSSIYDTDSVVTGKTNPNSSVYLQLEGNMIGSMKADAEGFFNLNINPLKIGQHVEIYAVDTRGNKSVLLTKIVDSPLIYTDDMKSQYEITGTLTATTSIQAYVKGVPIGKVSTQSVQGIITPLSEGKHFKISIPNLPVGTPVEVTGYDGDRKIKRVVRVKDLTPPFVTLYTVDDNDQVVKGKTEAYSAVKLYINKKYKKTVTSSKDGSFSFPIGKQKAGTEVKVMAADKAKNETVKYTKVVDKTPPPTPIIYMVDDNDLIIKGRTEAYTTVRLYLNKSYQKTVTSKKDGSYSFTIHKQKAKTEIKITAADKAKNISTRYTKVLDRTAPTVPSINKVTSKTKYVSGKAEPNTTVYIYRGKTKLGSHSVNSKGNYSVKISKQKKSTILTVFVKDQAGNKSKTKKIKVY